MISNSSTLPQEAFDRAATFLKTHARTLEKARFEFEFEGGSADKIFAALRTFQNEDGGFGNALEPDVRAPESSVLATTVALQFIKATDASAPTDLVEGGVNFLLKNFDESTQHFRIIPLSAENSPHAFWWNQTGKEEEFAPFSLNPTAEVLGILYDYRGMVPDSIIAGLTEKVQATLVQTETIEMHELLCLNRLHQTANLPADYAQFLDEKMGQLIKSTVLLNPADWGGYGLMPLQIIDQPSSQFLAGNEAAIQANLDHEISSQGEDGTWRPLWGWAEADAEAWAKAELDWAGWLTLEKLLILKRFGRL